jgi:C-terminal processing protease CtpA/Prc
MQFNSIRRFEIDWVEFRARTIAEAGDAASPAETYPTIRRALERIGDNHSFFRAPGSEPTHAGAQATGSQPELASVATNLIEAGIGFIEVPAFSGGGVAGDQLAALYHQLIERVDEMGVCGWVVDLRGNTGGDLWPMLAGVGPILGSGYVGSFVYPDSLVDEWGYRDGLAALNQRVVATAEPFYVRTASPASVAVLTDGRTASAGEGIAVAFRGRPATRSFGSPTRGLSTGNAGFDLTDGAVIFLTVAWMADRLGQIYREGLDPDSWVSGDKTGDRTTDATLEAALTWLETTQCS